MREIRKRKKVLLRAAALLLCVQSIMGSTDAQFGKTVQVFAQKARRQAFNNQRINHSQDLE